MPCTPRFSLTFPSVAQHYHFGLAWPFLAEQISPFIRRYFCSNHPLPPFLGLFRVLFSISSHPMATSVKQPENNRWILRQRHGHDRKGISSARWREHSFRRLSVEWKRDNSSRLSPPPRSTQRPLQQQSSAPVTTPSSSTSSLNLAVDYVGSVQMERTPSGTSIIPDKSFEPPHNNTLICCDKEAADMVETHFKRRSPDSLHERILRNLIRNLIKSPSPVDEMALDIILTMMDSIFFGGVLSGRVRWEWSHPSQQRFKTELIGTTALRPAAQGGFETLIVLSSPILQHPGYDPRLLLSAFLHELVHCYLFIQCGFEAREQEGHTDGFHLIVGIIDKWADQDNLRLCDMRANLDHFRNDRGRVMDAKVDAFRDHRHDGCNQSPRPRRQSLENVSVYPGWT